MNNSICIFMFLFIFSSAFSQVVNIEKFNTEKNAFEYFDKKFQNDLSSSKISGFLKEERAGKIKFVFGKYLAEKENDINLIFSKCGFDLNSKECWYGALSAFSSKLNDATEFLKLLKTLPCYDQKQSPIDMINFCDHAVGHSMYIFYKRNLEKSITACNDFFFTPKDKNYCVSGIFNHLFLERECTLSNEKNRLKDTFKCEGESAYQCFKFKFNGCLEKSKGNNFIFKNICQLKPDLRSSCYKGLGASVHFKKFKNGFLGVGNVCDFINTADRENCLLGFFESMGADELEKKKLINICNKYKSKKIKDICMEKSY